MRLWSFLVLLALCATPAQAEGTWPFGAGKGPFARGVDLHNLGLLGAKGSDADAPLAPVPAAAGGVRRGDPARGIDDDGPRRLRIQLLFPQGPAAAAGLVAGDVLVGVGRRPFEGPCRTVLAGALRKAEAGKGALTLLVQRGGAGEAQKVDVTLGAAGRAFARPTRGPARQAIFERALAWLAQRQQGDGGYPATLAGNTGAVVQTALAGLAWLAGGSDLEHGLYADNVRRAAHYVREHVGRAGAFADAMGRAGGRNWDQSNWAYAHAAIFLGELHGHGPDAEVRRALFGIGAQLCKRQETSGGWAHGPGGPNALGYVELNILSGLALCGLGLAGQAGVHVPEDVLQRAEAYLQASSAGDGGVGYSDQPGQKGQGNLGRTAGCWLGYETLGLGRSAWGQKMKRWVQRNAGAVLGGHASLMQHILLGGVAAHALGGKARTAYWDAMERDLTLARAPDGSLQPRPWHETLSMGTNSDVTFGEVWTTAAWAIVLGCEPEKGGRPGLPYWMGLARAEGRQR